MQLVDLDGQPCMGCLVPAAHSYRHACLTRMDTALVSTDVNCRLHRGL